MIPMAGTEELEDFGMLFFSKTRQKITDDHLFVSIVSRPTKSSFTRVQRLTCCVSLLFTTMIANAMFFRTSSGRFLLRVFYFSCALYIIIFKQMNKYLRRYECN